MAKFFLTKQLIRDRQVFLSWVLVNAVTVMFLGIMAAHYGGRIHGPSLFVIPAIIGIGSYASALAGRIAWQADNITPTNKQYRAPALLHRLEAVYHYTDIVQYLAMAATVFGMWTLLTDKGTNLHDRLLNGGGVAFSATFVGIVVSLSLMQSRRILDHVLKG